MADHSEDKRVKRKSYQRYAKPPYSYLAMIALVIRGSPDNMLKLSQILRDMEILFPFFRGDYSGWRDSVRHNLSSNDCFRKVLKDPGKPQAKGNHWTVEVGRIPRDAMKLQNTATARDGDFLFVPDLAPFILHNYKLSPGDVYQPATYLSPGAEGCPQGARLLSGSFLMDSPSPSRILWPMNSRLCSPSSTVSTMSPRSIDEEPERCRNLPTEAPPPRSHASLKRPRQDDLQSGSPARLPLPTSDLPTSYTKCIPPNVVAPPNVLPFYSLPQLSYFGCGSSPYINPAYWGLVSPPNNPRAEPSCPHMAAPVLDLDSMLRAVPPNKSVFDVLATHPGDVVHPAFLRQHVADAPGPKHL